MWRWDTVTTGSVHTEPSVMPLPGLLISQRERSQTTPMARRIGTGDYKAQARDSPAPDRVVTVRQGPPLIGGNPLSQEGYNTWGARKTSIDSLPNRLLDNLRDG